MCAFIICLLFLLFEVAICAPVEDVTQTTESVELRTEIPQGDSPHSNQEKNPVQEWFENLGKNATTNTQNAFNNVKEWFSKLSNNVNIPSASNLPVMYMGSFQLVKMPMPQLSDVIKGMGDLATAAQTVNKVVGNSGLPIPGIG